MQVFYVPGISGINATLNKSESYHCIHVLRHTVSDCIHLIDGNGGLYKARIIEADPHACRVEIIESNPDYKSGLCKLHIAIAPPKQADRFEWFLEKAVEIGVNEITPVRCHRSERKDINNERMEKIMIASMKQAIVAIKPTLNPMLPFPEFIKSEDTANKEIFIAYCDETANKPLHKALVSGKDTIVLIGPEGDFTPEEIRLAHGAGYKPVLLANRRLRTETAALVSCVVFNVMNS